MSFINLVVRLRDQGRVALATTIEDFLVIHRTHRPVSIVQRCDVRGYFLVCGHCSFEEHIDETGRAACHSTPDECPRAACPAHRPLSATGGGAPVDDH